MKKLATLINEISRRFEIYDMDSYCLGNVYVQCKSENLHITIHSDLVDEEEIVSVVNVGKDKDNSSEVLTLYEGRHVSGVLDFLQRLES
ncbi:hypothetical protein L4C54_15830 [Vibrio lamellibrachiae]|uniref:hypothetical protein n=1 Tax=Vibrio lamellibrachiae TaxID=2910253 RepID=UPI003D0FC468